MAVPTVTLKSRETDFASPKNYMQPVHQYPNVQAGYVGAAPKRLPAHSMHPGSAFEVVHGGGRKRMTQLPEVQPARWQQQPYPMPSSVAAGSSSLQHSNADAGQEGQRNERNPFEVPGILGRHLQSSIQQAPFQPPARPIMGAVAPLVPEPERFRVDSLLGDRGEAPQPMEAQRPLSARSFGGMTCACGTVFGSAPDSQRSLGGFSAIEETPRNDSPRVDSMAARAPRVNPDVSISSNLCTAAPAVGLVVQPQVPPHSAHSSSSPAGLANVHFKPYRL